MATTLTTPNYRLFFREIPPPPLKLNLNGNYPYYPNYLRFLERSYPYSYLGFILSQCIQYGYRFPLYQLFSASFGILNTHRPLLSALPPFWRVHSSKLKNGVFILTGNWTPQRILDFKYPNGIGLKKTMDTNLNVYLPIQRWYYSHIFNI